MNKKISFKDIWSSLLKYKKLLIKVLGITFVVACFLLLCIPNYYNAKVTLAPELSGKSASGGLSSLASSFGVNLGSATNGADALNPTLYPDMMNSVEFKTKLFPIKVHELNRDENFTYYDYLNDHQRKPWWSAAKTWLFQAIASLFRNGDDVNQVVNPFMLTSEQADIIKVMDEKISCSVDSKTYVISISVTDQDPLVAAVMADSVKQRLQDAITAYRTSKARVDLEYNKKLYEETKAKYDNARQQYAAYADANQGMILQSAQSRLIELQNEMQLQYQAYTNVATQLMAAEAKVQEETPAFTTLQNATVPVKKAGPSRAKLAILYCFLAFLITCIYVLHKESYLIPLIKMVMGSDEEESVKSE